MNPLSEEGCSSSAQILIDQVMSVSERVYVDLDKQDKNTTQNEPNNHNNDFNYSTLHQTQGPNPSMEQFLLENPNHESPNRSVALTDTNPSTNNAFVFAMGSYGNSAPVGVGVGGETAVGPATTTTRRPPGRPRIYGKLPNKEKKKGKVGRPRIYLRNPKRRSKLGDNSCIEVAGTLAEASGIGGGGQEVREVVDADIDRVQSSGIYSILKPSHCSMIFDYLEIYKWFVDRIGV